MRPKLISFQKLTIFRTINSNVNANQIRFSPIGKITQIGLPKLNFSKTYRWTYRCIYKNL